MKQSEVWALVVALAFAVLLARGAETNEMRGYAALTEADLSVLYVTSWTGEVQSATLLVTSWVERIPAYEHTNAVNDLARAGVICAVLGHAWRDGRAGESASMVYLDYHPGVYYRTCQICGKGQSRNEGEWK